MTQFTQGLDPAWVARVTGGVAGEAVQPARDLVWDSREVTPGTAFVALPGQRTHGNRFLEDAVRRGAAFLLTDRPHPRAVRVDDPYRALLRLGRALRDRFRGTLIGVTGSVGKTSTKEAIAQGLGFAAPAGNLNTPPALTRFFLHLDPGAPGAVVELGIDRPGEIDELLALAAPDFGVLTAVAPAHLEGLGDLTRVAMEKARLLRTASTGLAEVSAARVAGVAGVATYGFDPAADHPATDLTLSPAGARFRYRGWQVRVPYPSRGAALAALAALAVAEHLGLPLVAVRKRLARLRLPPGRMQVMQKGALTVIHDAYNANPASLAAGLEALSAFPGRKVVVLGEMKELGPEAVRYHREAARQAARVGEVLVFVGPHAKAMAEAAGKGQPAADLKEAGEALRRALRPGDVLYLKASRAVGLEALLEVLDD